MSLDIMVLCSYTFVVHMILRCPSAVPIEIIVFTLFIYVGEGKKG